MCKEGSQSVRIMCKEVLKSVQKVREECVKSYAKSFQRVDFIPSVTPSLNNDTC